ncbi:MAG: dihydropteroate synthase [Candidatus Eisenbacteria bacterium]|nr:dihydropteroate synthase [Candidatus Eisenbacteria bacterium]
MTKKPLSPDTNLFRFRGGAFDLSSRTHVVGILNVTPDSFSDGGRFADPDSALRHAEKMAGEGADIIDVGGESTRPFSEPVDESTETRRVVPVISAIARRFDIPVSVDTCKASVAAAAVDAGARIINDISALRFDSRMGEVAARLKTGVILMHMKGTPRNMQENPEYADVMSEIRVFLSAAVKRARSHGIEFERIMLDPGIGFGKKLEHNLTILRNLSDLADLRRPILVGPSRKSFIGLLTNRPVDERLSGTLAAVVGSVLNGASAVRVHDVGQAREAATVADAILRGVKPGARA